MTDDDHDILDQLERRLAHHVAEASRYRQAIAVLRGVPRRDPAGTSVAAGGTEPRQPTSSPPGRGRTPAAIRAALQHAAEPISLPDLIGAMEHDGWETTSRTPKNTVLTALGRLVEQGAVERTEDGRYISASSGA